MRIRHVFGITGRFLTVALVGLLGCARPEAKPEEEQPAGLRARLDGHSEVRRAVFSPDGQTLAVSSKTEAVRVWDLKTGKELFRLARAVNAKALVFSPDGHTIATACEEPIIRFWDAKSGREKPPIRGDIGKVTLLAFSPDGATLASWSEQKYWSARILFWNLASGTQKKPLDLAIGFTNSIGFSPDGQTLAVAQLGPDGVSLYNLMTHSRQFVPMGPGGEFKGWASEVYYCPDGRRLAFFQEETVVRLWDLDKRREQSAFPCSGRANLPNTALRPDGKLAATGDADGILTLWDPETSKKIAVVQASRLHIPDPSFSPDGRTMATHEVLESAVKIWDVAALVGKGK